MLFSLISHTFPHLKGHIMPKAKPGSLVPRSFEKAIRKLNGLIHHQPGHGNGDSQQGGEGEEGVIG